MFWLPAPLYESLPLIYFASGWWCLDVLRTPWAYWPGGLLILLGLLVTGLRVNARLGVAQVPADPRAEAGAAQDKLDRLARSELSEWEER